MQRGIVIAGFVCAGLAAICPAPARAGLVVGNLTSINNSAGSFSNINSRLGAPFTTSAGFTSVGLASVTLRLGTDNLPASVRVSLWSGVDSLPGGEVLGLGNASLSSSTYSDFVFTAPTAFPLQASMNYWIVIQKLAGTGIVRWRATAGGHTLDPGSDPSANIPTGIGASSGTNGASWGNDGIEKLFSVQSVPSPGVAGALVLGGLLARAVGVERAG